MRVGVRHSVWGWIGLAVLAAWTSAARADCVVRLEFQCQFTQASRLEIPPELLLLRFKPGTEKVDLAPLKQIIEIAKARPDLDYTDCLTPIPYGAVKLVKATGRDTIKHCVQVQDALDEQMTESGPALDGLIAQYAKEAYERGALPYYEPASEPVPRLRADELRRETRFIDRCSPFASDQALGLRVLQSLPRRVAGKSPECRQKIARAYARELISMQLDSKQCAKFPARCRERQRQVGVVLNYLNAAGLTDAFLPPWEQVQVARTCTIDDWAGMNAEFERLIQGSQDLVACQSPAVGENVVYAGVNAGGQSTEYTLKRTGANRYRATVNLAFEIAGADGEAIDPESVEELRKHARGCLAEVSGGPLNGQGQTLDLNLYDPAAFSNPDPAPPIHTIEIDEDVRRVNSETWKSKMPCSTIVHEVMHVLGLNDEYVEKASGKSVRADGSIENVEKGAQLPEYDCRSIGPEDSLMNHQEEAYDAYWPKTISYCRCPPGDEACVVGSVNLPADAEKCPGQGKLYGEKVDPKDPALRRRSKMEDSSRGMRVNLNLPLKKSLLYPAQLRAILWPGCLDRNATFFACGRDAYNTSAGRFANRWEDKCSAAKPKVCMEGGAAWLR